MPGELVSALADLKEQVILEVLILGLRMSDATTLEWETFDVDKEAPIPIKLVTQKEKVIAETFISQEFKEILEKYLPTLKMKNKYLLQTNRSGHTRDEELNQSLEKLAERAGVKVLGRLTWHCGRKLVLRS